MNLAEQISEIVTYFDDPPDNEANTCDLVIRPLLSAIGYSLRDISRESQDHAGNRPDYTILPNEPAFRFHIEAKAWNVALQDKHVNQAISYAHLNGDRWVLLTNGHMWRLYDDEVRGMPFAKLAIEIEIQNQDEAFDFFSAICKESVRNAQLEKCMQEIRAQIAAKRSNPSNKLSANIGSAEPSGVKLASANLERAEENPASMQDSRGEFRKQFLAGLIEYLARNGHKRRRGTTEIKGSSFRIVADTGSSQVIIGVKMTDDLHMRVAVRCVKDPTNQIFQAFLRCEVHIKLQFSGNEVAWESKTSRIAVYRHFDRTQVSQDTPQRQELFHWVSKNLTIAKRVARKWLPEEQGE